MIRNIATKDIPQICSIYNYYVLHTNASFETEPLSQLDMENRVLEFTRDYPWLVVEQQGSVLGYCYASKWRPRAAYRYTIEVTVYLERHHLGKGFGKQLYQELFSQLKAMGIHSLIATIAIPNENSQALHESLGFKQVALFKDMGYKLDQWIDVGYWQLML